MLRAGKVGLRARDEADVAVLHAELYEDIATRMRADSRPWRPIPAGSAASPYAVSEPRDDVAVFSVVALAGGELAGEALLWAIDSHNRTAHLQHCADVLGRCDVEPYLKGQLRPYRR